ncbi:hypothetical protein RvY_01575-2 [Ramazzottius varieornatus]|uniref:Uncharacterized protein n=1 Tax=Ramazzottius varieornatus TaxID=947166 RepID=A0A1D1UGU4_RAMVA|nr:hypothetical protein RvY_01575-2 [Ramazzottius varieornatus]
MTRHHSRRSRTLRLSHGIRTCKPLRAYLLLGIRKEWHLVPLKKDLDECAPPQTAVLEPDDRRREDASNSQRQDREMPDPGS